MEKESQTKENKIRPPIVVVMGHIDHGKTKILDWYRKTKVVEQESGGITQHIGAYEVIHNGKKITFIDTPGHQAFSKMRSRGAKVADIAVLVVAADEGIKPQTKEAIEIIQENNLPFVVAINKIDKLEANPDRVKQQLAEANVIVESYGGKVPSVEISAKTGEHMDDLLEVLLLMAELDRPEEKEGTEGVVIEAHLDSRRGITATLLLISGKIEQGNAVVIGKSVETIKILEDFLGKSIPGAAASSPVRVAGLSETPVVGEVFKRFTSKTEAEDYVKNIPEDQAKPKIAAEIVEEGKPVFNIILKTDVAGSKEALEGELKKIETSVIKINILRSEVGNINETDMKLALATKLVTIVGFRVKVDASAQELAERNNIHLVRGDVIYEVLDSLKKEMEEMLPPIVNRVSLGKAKILKLFKKEGSKQIIGGRVDDGIIRSGAKAEVKRLKESVGIGAIANLQREKQQVSEVGKGSEFGMMIDSKVAIEEGDTLEVFQEEILKQKL